MKHADTLQASSAQERSTAVAPTPSSGKKAFCEGDRQELMERYYPLVRSVVNSMRCYLPPCADLDELHSVGVTGLVSAVGRYDPAQAPTFEGYAALRIRGAILDELRRMDWMPRASRNKARQLAKAVETLEQKHGRAPTENEIREHMGLNLSEFRRLQIKVRPVSFISLDGPVNTDSEGVDLHEAIPDEHAENCRERIEKSELFKLVSEKIQLLNERQRKVLALYYFEGMRLSEIAEIYGVTEARICQIHTQALGILRKHCSAVN